MARWYDKAVEDLEDDLQSGNISQADFNAQMRDLSAELRDEAFEAGEQAREQYLGGW